MISDVSDAKQQAQRQWNSTPCGTGSYLDKLPVESREWFDEIRRSRYVDTDPWMKRVIPFARGKGQKLLEIGHGIGSDLLEFAIQGAEAHGIDITEEHHRLAKLNFKVHNLSCDLKLCDAADIDFPSNCFDLVYSNGVLHHTNDTVRCISEAYRVLKPGGIFILSLYHTWSVFHIVEKLLIQGVLKGDLRRLGYRGLMATVECGADGLRIRPLVKTFSKRQLKNILADFTSVEFQIAHLHHVKLSRLGKWAQGLIERIFEPHFGWYIVAFCKK